MGKGGFMLRNLKLLTKITLLVSAILLAFFALFALYAYRHQADLVLGEAVEKARIVAYEAIRAREYLSRALRDGDVELNRERFGLIPVVASTRIALLAAEDAGFRVRQVSSRYRNPKNAPDAFEQQALETLGQQSGDGEFYAVADFEGARVLRYVKPFFADESCLECHGKPSEAPKFIQQLYPPERDQAYNYRLGEIIGAASVVVPMAHLEARINDNLNQLLLFVAAALGVMMLCLGLLTRLAITRPLERLGLALGELERSGKLAGPLPHPSNDEIGELIKGFNQMNDALREKTSGLEESERRYRVLTESSRDGVISFLPEGQIILFNREAERMFACQRIDVLGESVIRLVHGDCEEVHKLGVEAYLERHGAALTQKVVTMPVRRLDGSSFRVELSLVNVAEEGYRFYTATLRPLR